MAAKTMQMPNLQIPTGYEKDQQKIALKRKLAQAMLERGLAPNRGAISPLETLGSLAQAFVGKRMDKKAGNMEADLQERIKGDYAAARQGFQTDANGGAMDAKSLVQKYGGNPMLSADLEPYKDAFASSLRNREEIKQIGNSYGRVGDYEGKEIPGKPTDKVISVNNEWKVNPVAMTADLFSNPLPPGAEVSGGMNSMANPYAQGAPQASQPPMQAGGAPPAANGGGLDLSKLSPEEKQVLAQELSRRGQPGVPPAQGLTPPPHKTIGNQQYWSVGGKWFDNPEGR